MKKHRTKLLGTSSYTSKHDLIVNMYRRARNRSIKKNIEFNIELSDIQIPGLCPLLKVPLVSSSRYSASLDRKDNTKGYIKGNIAVISTCANNIKADASYEELITFSRNIKKYLKQ